MKAKRKERKISKDEGEKVKLESNKGKSSHYFHLLLLTISVFTTASRATLGPTQPPVQWVPVSLSPRVKRQRSEADHSPPSSAEVKE
jgi:hypothetical protein